MDKIRVKNRFLKIVCFIIFIIVVVKYFYSIKKIYSEYKKEVEVESGSILLPFKIRRENFFVTNPLYIPSIEKSNVIIKKNGMELTLEEIIKSDDELAKVAAEKFSANTVTESTITASTVEVNEENNKEDEILEVVKTNDVKLILSNNKQLKIEPNTKQETVKKNVTEQKKIEEKVEKNEPEKKEIKEEKINNIENKKGYYIQLGIFASKENALKLQDKLKEYKVIITEEKSKNDTVNYKVTINGMSNRSEAEEIAEKLKSILNGVTPIVKVRY